MLVTYSKCAFCTLPCRVGKDAGQLTAEIKELAPEGIDNYFDNTGGAVTDAVINNLNQFARSTL